MKTLKDKIRKILNTYSDKDLSNISFNTLYKKLITEHSDSELKPLYKELLVFFFKYGKLLIDTKQKIKNKNKNTYNKREIQKTRKIINLKPGTKRCPKTYRKYKNGKCFKYITLNATNTQMRSKIINQTKKKILKLGPGRKRCPRGYIMNLKSGYCENK